MIIGIMFLMLGGYCKKVICKYWDKLCSLYEINILLKVVYIIFSYIVNFFDFFFVYLWDWSSCVKIFFMIIKNFIYCLRI